MRTALMLASGGMLLASLYIVARLFSEHFPSATTWAVVAFLVLWLAITGANMAIGVMKAGYTVTEELPILLLLFGIPAVAAILLKWRLG